MVSADVFTVATANGAGIVENYVVLYGVGDALLLATGRRMCSNFPIARIRKSHPEQEIAHTNTRYL